MEALYDILTDVHDHATLGFEVAPLREGECDPMELGNVRELHPQAHVPVVHFLDEQPQVVLAIFTWVLLKTKTQPEERGHKSYNLVVIVGYMLFLLETLEHVFLLFFIEMYVFYFYLIDHGHLHALEYVINNNNTLSIMSIRIFFSFTWRSVYENACMHQKTSRNTVKLVPLRSTRKRSSGFDSHFTSM